MRSACRPHCSTGGRSSRLTRSARVDGADAGVVPPTTPPTGRTRRRRRARGGGPDGPAFASALARSSPRQRAWPGRAVQAAEHRVAVPRQRGDPTSPAASTSCRHRPCASVGGPGSPALPAAGVETWSVPNLSRDTVRDTKQEHTKRFLVCQEVGSVTVAAGGGQGVYADRPPCKRYVVGASRMPGSGSARPTPHGWCVS